MSARTTTGSTWLGSIALLAALVALWWVASNAGWVSRVFLPTPQATLMHPDKPYSFQLNPTQWNTGSGKGFAAERGIDICHETMRLWWNRFGPLFADDVRRQRVSRMRGFRQWRWHLDEVYVTRRAA